MDTLVEPAPIGCRILDHVRECVGALGKDLRELGPEETQTLADRNAALQQEGSDLVDDAGLPGSRARDAALASRLFWWALDSFGDCFGVAEIVPVSFAIRFDVLRWQEPRVVAKRMQLAAEGMGSDAGLRAGQARRQVGQPGSNLAGRPSLAHDDCTTLIETDNVKPILVDIDDSVLAPLAVLLRLRFVRS